MSRKMCYNTLQNYFSVETIYTNIFNSLELININELFGFIKEFCNKVLRFCNIKLTICAYKKNFSSKFYEDIAERIYF